MELLKLLGIVIVIAGFALKLDSILVILVAAVVTALVGGLGPVTLLETLGSTFVANRSMAIFIIVMLVTGTLERNGLREAAAALIGKFKGATSGLVIGIYGVMRSIFAAFNVGFGGVAGFVRPVIMPMAEGAIVAQGYEPNEEHVEELKGMASGMENITWFFGQVLFVGGSGGLLVQSTLSGRRRTRTPKEVFSALRIRNQKTDGSHANRPFCAKRRRNRSIQERVKAFKTDAYLSEGSAFSSKAEADAAIRSEAIARARAKAAHPRRPCRVGNRYVEIAAPHGASPIETCRCRRRDTDRDFAAALAAKRQIRRCHPLAGRDAAGSQYGRSPDTAPPAVRDRTGRF